MATQNLNPSDLYTQGGHGHGHRLFIWMIKINDGPASNLVQGDHGCLQLEPRGITCLYVWLEQDLSGLMATVTDMMRLYKTRKNSDLQTQL